MRNAAHAARGKEMSLMLNVIDNGLHLGRGYGASFKNNKVSSHDLEAGKHQCVTTRKTDSDKSDVVGKNCKLFNTGNLYIAGSSVLPTIGYANATLTIVALALRLSEYLKGKLA